MAVYLIESKADQQKLIDHVGEDTAKLFFTLKDRLKSPENDIYFWLKRSPEILKRRLDDLQSIKTRSQKDAEASEGAELVYSGDGWRVYHIITYEASKKYGKNTQWCIAGSKRWNNGGNGEQYFNDYTNRGVEFYFYIKDGTEKYALAYTPSNGRYQVFNSVDDDITLEDLSFLPAVKGLPQLSLVSLISEDGTFIYDDPSLSRKLYTIKDKIKHLVISNNIKSIPDDEFSYCGMKTVEIPNSVTYIGDDAFKMCTALTEVHLPDSVESLGFGCFSNCDQLRKINIPQNENLTIIPNNMLYYTDVEELVIPENIRQIGSLAFIGTNITHLVLPEGVKSIRPSTFKGMHALESIVVPSTLYEIREKAFTSCDHLESIDLSHTSISYIGEWAFSDCRYLMYVSLPKTLFTIESHAFFNCESIESIHIPSSVDSIEYGAFQYCSGLTDVYLENTSLASLGGEVFKGCILSNLTIHVSGPQKDFVASAILAEYDGKINLDIRDN